MDEKLSLLDSTNNEKFIRDMELQEKQSQMLRGFSLLLAVNFAILGFGLYHWNQGNESICAYHKLILNGSMRMLMQKT